MTSKRVAVRFQRGEAVKLLPHVESLRLWDDALRQSRLPVAATEGRSPRPRFALAAPLPVGYTSDAERLELALRKAVDPSDLLAELNANLPDGFRALECRPLERRSPSLQSQLRWAEYEVSFEPEVEPGALNQALDSFFRRQAFPWQETIEGKTKSFDLLDLVDDLWVAGSGECLTLRMRLDASGTGTGRPDSVLAGLSIPEPASKRRTCLVFSYLPEAKLIWRRQGRFES